MSNSSDEMDRHIDALLPVSTVLQHAATFLSKCDWRLEIDGEIVEIPKNADLIVRSRAFIKADLDDVFLGDHLEAVVILGAEELQAHMCAKYGVLRIYFDLNGQFISEDRYNKFK